MISGACISFIPKTECNRKDLMNFGLEEVAYIYSNLILYF